MSLKHMKSLIVLVVGLLSAGCEKGGEITIGEPPKEEPAMNPEQKALRDSVVGEYEHKVDNGVTLKLVFLDNGVHWLYANGKKHEEFKWSISNGEIHINDSGKFTINIWRKNTDKSITSIARIRDGKRTDLPKEEQNTLKKIK